MVKIKMKTACVTKDMQSYKKGQIYTVSNEQLKLFNVGFYEIMEAEKKASPVKKPTAKKGK